MSNGYIKALIPHFVAIAVFLVLSSIYYSPSLSGKVLRQSDNIQAKGMQKEINELRAKDGKHPLWTNSMFGGMPVYQVHLPSGNNMVRYFNKVFLMWGTITSPVRSMFLLMIMFYILMIAMGVDWRIGIIGAIAYGLATNHVVLTEAGHTTKIITMAYLPPTLGGIMLAFRGKYLAGGILTALFLSLQVLANHIQVTYYFFFALAILGILEGIKASKSNQLPQFGKAVGVLVLAGLIGVGANLARLWTTYEYTAETIRGQSELTVDGPFSQNSSTNKDGDGLSKDYIFGWSYGISESFTVLIPDYMGRASGSAAIDDKGQFKDSETGRTIKNNIMPRLQGQQDGNQVLQQLVRATNPYRGDVQFTSGPMYYGSIICFLFILGLFLVRGSMKWWLLSSTILMFMFGWGRHFGVFNYFLYDHFPMFNKFRAVMMAVGVGQLFVTLLAMLAVKELVYNKTIASEAKKKAILMAGGIVGGLCALIYLGSMGGFIDFSGPRDAAILSQYPDLQTALYADRAEMLQMDALRSLLLIGLAAGALWAYAADKLKWVYALPVLGALVLIDFWGVDQRFLSHEDFKTKQEVNSSVPATTADNTILKDTDPHYRVLDVSRGSPWQSASASYFHKSIGGYHAAKLVRFQDLCEHYLFNPAQSALTDNLSILGMFNVKYVIVNSDSQPFSNPNATGPSWFVKEYEIVENADAEIKALGTLDPRSKAVIDKKHADYLEGMVMDSTITPGDHITLTSYHPDNMVYTVKATKERLAMFSEIYYPPSKGWNVYIDGKKQDPAFIKANYAIRAARVPAGEYQLEMRFEPKSYKVGSLIGLLCSLLIIGGLGFLLFKTYTGFDAAGYIEKENAEKRAVKEASNKKSKKKEPKPTSPRNRKQSNKRRKK